MNPIIRKIQSNIKSHGLFFVIIRYFEKSFLPRQASRLTREIYIELASFYYGQQKVDQYSDSPNLYKIIWVSPEEIAYLTPRPYPPWRHIDQQFGGVLTDWQDVESYTTNCQNTTPKYLYSGPKITETIVHKSITNHFSHGVSWEDTELIQEVRSLVDKDYTVWNQCSTQSDITKRCNELDELYSKIADDGYKTQIELVRELKRPLSRYPRLVSEEIIIDIGPNGELLLVDGRHRLSIARILGLERIPVAVAFRHEEWMEKRQKVARGEITIAHPDFEDIQPKHNFHTF